MGVLDVIETENLLNNAAQVDDYLRDELTKLQDRFESMAEVRGHGLYIVLEWVSDRPAEIPDRNGAMVFVNRLKDKGFRIGISGALGNVLWICPPLVFAREHADLFLTAFEETMEEIIAHRLTMAEPRIQRCCEVQLRHIYPAIRSRQP